MCSGHRPSAREEEQERCLSDLALNGGIAPAPRRRARVALRGDEREEISRGIAAGQSMRQIAQRLGRSPSTVSREIRRNGGCSAYRASEAETSAWERALRPKSCRLARHSELRWRVAQKLALQWSPEQVSGWLKRLEPTAQVGRADHCCVCPFIGVKRSCRLRARTDVNDPQETSAAQDFRSAKALFVPSLKRDIVSSVACTRPPAGGSHGNPHPTARIHIHTGRRGGGVAARGTRPAAGKATDHRVPGHDHAFGR